MYNIVQLERTCIACPSQWEGELDTGQSVYIRFRHGQLTIDIDDTCVLSIVCSDRLDGSMSNEALISLTKAKFNYMCDINDIE